MRLIINRSRKEITRLYFIFLMDITRVIVTAICRWVVSLSELIAGGDIFGLAADALQVGGLFRETLSIAGRGSSRIRYKMLLQ